MSKNTPSGTTTSTQTSSPWSGQVPFLAGGTFGGPWGTLPGTSGTGQNSTIPAGEGILGILPAAAGLYENYTPQYYPGQTYAGPTAAQNSAVAATENLGANGSPVAAPATATNNNFLNGTYLANDPAMGALSAFSGINPNSNAGASALNSYATGQMAALGNPYTAGEAQSVLSSVVPSIESQFISGGDLASPEAAYATAAGATNALAPILFNNFQTEQQNQLNAAGEQVTAANNLQGAYGQNMQQTLGGLALAPTTQQMPYTDLSQEYNAGATQQANQQSAINDAVNRYNYNETLPYNMLNQYIGEVTGNYGGTSTLTQPFFSNSGTNALGGAAAGASLGSSLLGPAGLGFTSTAGGGAGIGAGLGALLALL